MLSLPRPLGGDTCSSALPVALLLGSVLWSMVKLGEGGAAHAGDVAEENSSQVPSAIYLQLSGSDKCSRSQQPGLIGVSADWVTPKCEKTPAPCRSGLNPWIHRRGPTSKALNPQMLLDPAWILFWVPRRVRSFIEHVS